MLNSFDVDNIETMTAQRTNWFYVGGRATNQSYIDEFTNSQGQIDDFDLRMRVGKDLAWLDSLPHHIVLDDFRLVHAGYSPWDGDLDLQSTDTLMWIRVNSQFYYSCGRKADCRFWPFYRSWFRTETNGNLEIRDRIAKF